MFLFIFYCNVGVSGGDIAIYALNALFGVIQILTVLVLIRKKKSKYHKVIFFIIICQIIEFITMNIFGYNLNSLLKSYFIT
jgi:hypothetical protein